MRGKTARRLRKFTSVVHPKVSVANRYEPLKPTTVYDTPVPLTISKRAMFLGQRTLSLCLRRLYQESKKAWKAASHTERQFPEDIK